MAIWMDSSLANSIARNTRYFSSLSPLPLLVFNGSTTWPKQAVTFSGGPYRCRGMGLVSCYCCLKANSGLFKGSWWGVCVCVCVFVVGAALFFYLFSIVKKKKKKPDLGLCVQEGCSTHARPRLVPNFYGLPAEVNGPSCGGGASTLREPGYVTHLLNLNRAIIMLHFGRLCICSLYFT